MTTKSLVVLCHCFFVTEDLEAHKGEVTCLWSHGTEWTLELPNVACSPRPSMSHVRPAGRMPNEARSEFDMLALAHAELGEESGTQN